MVISRRRLCLYGTIGDWYEKKKKVLFHKGKEIFVQNMCFFIMKIHFLHGKMLSRKKFTQLLFTCLLLTNNVGEFLFCTGSKGSTRFSQNSLNFDPGYNGSEMM